MINIKSAAIWLIAVYALSIVFSGLLTPTEKTNELSASHMYGPGSSDYFTFWASWRIMLAGDNPYHPESYQTYLGITRDQQHVMFPPPWAVLITAPLGMLPFALSTQFWLVFNVVLLVAAAWLSLTLIRKPSPKILGVACCFAPAALCLNLGQITIALTVVFCLLIKTLMKHQYFWAGILTGILTIKPHLFFLLFAVLGLSMLRGRKWTYFGGLASALMIMLGSISLIHPDAIGNWFSFLMGKAPMDWVGSTFPAWFRLGWNYLGGGLPNWPNMVIPITALVFCILAYWRKMEQIEWHITAPWLLALSLCFSPYGHPYDQALLLPMHCILLALSTQARLPSLNIICRITFFSLLVLQVLWIVQLSWISKELYLLAWFTPALMLLYVWGKQTLRI